MEHLVKILILIQEGIIKKISYERRDYIWVGRREEPNLGYVPINCEKQNSGGKGLNA